MSDDDRTKLVGCAEMTTKIYEMLRLYDKTSRARILTAVGVLFGSQDVVQMIPGLAPFAMNEKI